MTKESPLKNPLILALDVDSEQEALNIAMELADVVGGIKLGPRLVLRYGPEFVQKIAKLSPVFLDFKFFDIPSTMESSVRAAFDLGASLVTVHAQSGKDALTHLAQVEKELAQIRPFKVLAVTILTSFEQYGLPSILKPQEISQHVLELKNLVKDSGLNGIVCSPHELELFENEEDLYIVTPGIRGSAAAAQDQKRFMGPQEAIKAGATAIVVGRPILESTNRLESATKFLMSIYN